MFLLFWQVSSCQGASESFAMSTFFSLIYFAPPRMHCFFSARWLAQIIAGIAGDAQVSHNISRQNNNNTYSSLHFQGRRGTALNGGKHLGSDRLGIAV